MAVTIRLKSSRKRLVVDVVDLVTRRAEALRGHLSRALIDGVSPIDGSDRPRKPDGKPLGFRTGRLARGLRLSDVKRSRNRASVTIRLPRGQPADEFRESFVAAHDDIMTTEGNAARVLELATQEFLDDRRSK